MGGYFLDSYSAPPALLAATMGRGREREEREVKGGKDKKGRAGWRGKRRKWRRNVRGIASTH